MGKTRKVFSKEFRIDAVRYRNDHPELTVKQCAVNLDIGESTLDKWLSEYRKDPENSFRGSGNYESEETKQIARLRKENKDLKDALEVLKKAIGILSD